MSLISTDISLEMVHGFWYNNEDLKAGILCLGFD